MNKCLLCEAKDTPMATDPEATNGLHEVGICDRCRTHAAIGRAVEKAGKSLWALGFRQKPEEYGEPSGPAMVRPVTKWRSWWEVGLLNHDESRVEWFFEGPTPLDALKAAGLVDDDDPIPIQEQSR